MFWNKPIKYTVVGIGGTIAALICGKILYDYSMYSNLKYIKKQLKNLERYDDY